MRRIIIAVLVYALIMTILYFAAPAMMMNPDGTLKSWGLTSATTSLFSIQILVVFVALISYFIAAIIDNML